MVIVVTTVVDVARSKWTVVFGKDYISDLLTLLLYHFNKGEIKNDIFFKLVIKIIFDSQTESKVWDICSTSKQL